MNEKYIVLIKKKLIKKMNLTFSVKFFQNYGESLLAPIHYTQQLKSILKMYRIIEKIKHNYLKAYLSIELKRLKKYSIHIFLITSTYI